MSSKQFVMIAFVVVCGVSSAFGTTILHDDFESPWTVMTYVYGANGNGSPGQAFGDGGIAPCPDGAASDAYVNTFKTGDQAMFINVTSPGTYQANTVYTLSAYIGQRTDGYAGADWRLSMTKNDAVVVAHPQYGYPMFGSAGTAVTSVTGTSTTSGWSFVSVTKSISASDPLIGTPIGVEFCSSWNPSGNQGLQQLQVDGIKLDATAVPEPVTLLVLGLGGLFLRRRVA